MPSDLRAPYCGTRNAFQSTSPLDLCLTNTGIFGDQLAGGASMDLFPLWNGIEPACVFHPYCCRRGYYDCNGEPQRFDAGASAAVAPALPITASLGIDDGFGTGPPSPSNLFGYAHQGLQGNVSVLPDFRPSTASVFELESAGTLSETSCPRPQKRSRTTRTKAEARTRTTRKDETNNSPETVNFSSAVPDVPEGGKSSRNRANPTGSGSTGGVQENRGISTGSRISATWTREEDGRLASAVARHGTESWIPVSTFVSSRTPMECATRWYGTLNHSFRRGRWTSQEDEHLKSAVAEWVRSVVGSDAVHGDGGSAKTTEDWLALVDGCGGYKAVPWKEISKTIAHRNAVQCQTRWTETLDPHVKKSAWTPEEDETLVRGVETWSHSWNRIAAAIPGRTQRQCRSRYIQISTQRELAESESLATNGRSRKSPDPKFVPEFLDVYPNSNEPLWRYEDFLTTQSLEPEAFPFRSGEPVEYPVNC